GRAGRGGAARLRRASRAAVPPADRGSAGPARRRGANGARRVDRAGPVLAVCAAVPVPAGGGRLVAAVSAPPGHPAGCAADPPGRARRGRGGAPTRGGAGGAAAGAGPPGGRGGAGQVVLTAALAPAGARSQLGVRMT